MKPARSATDKALGRTVPATTAPDTAVEDALELAYQLGAIVACLDDTATIADAAGRPFFWSRPGLGLAPGSMPPEAHTRLASLDAEVVATGAHVEDELTIPLPDGIRHVHVSKHPYRGRGGGPTGVITLQRDVTERRVLEHALRAQNDQLRTLDLMKTDFVNTVSHELRTPLTSILAYAEFLEDRMGGELTDTQVEYLGHILDSTRHLQRLVDDLLDFGCGGRTLRLRFAADDLAAKAAEVVESLRPQAHQRELALLLELPDGPTPLVMDAGRVAQVLLNLVGNAIKFTPKGGTILVRVRRTPDGAAAEVVDDGIGIAPRDVPFLFERFYQVDNSTTRERGGAGLGLFISRTIIEAHGGALHVESEYGEGSRFWFALPGEPPEAAAPDDLV